MKLIYLKSFLTLVSLILVAHCLNAQCSATITVNGLPTGCGNRVLNASPIGDVWTQKASMIQNRTLAAGFSIGNKGYIGTGTTPSNTYNNDLWEYDASLNSWTQKANFPGTARIAAVGFAVGSKGYIGTGLDLNNIRRNDFYEYDPLTNTWIARASITGSRSYAVGFSIGTKAYVGTGYVSVNYVNDFYEFDPVLNSWTPKANFPGTGRHSATAFSIGTKGYLGFGSTGTAGTGDFWEYTPANNTWVQKASIYGMQMFAASGFALGGKGYMVGGKDQGTTNLFSSQTYQYDPVTNLWRLVALNNANAKNYGVAFTIGGKGYYGTGSAGNSTSFATNVLYEYEPKANYLWSNSATTPSISVVGTASYSVLIITASGCTTSATQTIATSPNPTISVSGGSLICSAANNTLVASGANSYTWSANAGGVIGPQAVVSPTISTTYTVAGTSGSCTVNFPVSVFVSGAPATAISVSGSTVGCGVRTLSVNPGGDTWTQKANMNIGRERAIAFSIGSKGYIGTGTQGGALGAKDFWEYDPIADTWTQKADFAGGSRYHAYYFALGGKGYAGGGFSTLGLYGFAMDFWEYDPVTNVWTRKGDVPMTHRNAAVSLAIGNKGYMGGGQDNYGNFAFKDFWEYNPLTDTWTQKTDIPSLGRGGPSAFSIGNKGYLGLGYPAYPSTVVLNDFYEYNPINDTWTALANYPGGGNANGIGFSIGNKGYVTNGSYVGNAAALWEYNPSNNTWTARTDFPGGARPWSVAFVIGNKAYTGTGPIGSTLVDYKDLWEYNPKPSIAWSTGAITPSIIASTSGNYSVTINSLPGCSVTSVQTLSLSPSPTVLISGNPNYLCAGLSATINATGASSYTWSANAGGGNTSSVILTPINSTSYSLTASNGTCTAVEPVTLNTLPTPPSTLSVSGPTQTCGTLTLSVNAPPIGWTQKNSLSTGRRQAVSFTIGNKAYVGLGQSSNATLSDLWEFDPLANSWTQKANHPAGPRYESTAFSINSKGYVACGYDNTSTPTNDFWEYDPNSNTWAQKLSLTTTRAGAVGFGLNGKGYVGLGDGASHDVWEYDPTANTWTQKANYSGGPRAYAASFVIGAKAYVGTGYGSSSSTSDFWEFDPIANTWTSKAAYGGGNIYNAKGFSLNNKGYFVGGNGANLTNALWEYNPGLNTWTQKTPFTAGPRTELVAFSIGNKGYAGTGFNPIVLPYRFADIWEFDPGNSTTWSTGSTLQAIHVTSSGSYSVLINNSYGCSASAIQTVSLSPNPTITVSGIPTILCSGLTSTLIANGANTYTWSANAGGVNVNSVNLSPLVNTTYTVSGTTGICTVDFPITILVSNTPTVSIASSGPTLGCGSTNLSVNSPSSNWTQKTNLNIARSQAVAFTIANKGYVGLGLSATSSNLNDFWEYDPNLNSWTQKANFSGGGRGNSAGFSIGNKGYVACGYVTSSSQWRNDLWQYDPLNNTWVQKASLPGIARHNCVGFAINGKGYVGLGAYLSGSVNDLWEYDPVNDTWLQKANYSGGLRSGAFCFVIGNQAYVGAGMNNSTNVTDMWAYNPVTDTWLAKASFPGTPVRLSTGFALGTRAYVGLGTTGVNDLNTFWEYNSVSNTWIQIANFPGAARQTGVSFAINDKAYVTTGYNGFNIPNTKNDLWEFKQVNTINWSTGSTLQTIPALVSGNYSVTVSNPDGCSSSAVQSLSLSPSPTIGVSILSGSACAGNSQTLTASGAATYTWSSNAGGVNTASVIVSPSVATLYTLSGSNGTCTVDYPLYLDLHPTPTASIIPLGSTTLCGSALTLSSNPGVSNTWTQRTSVTNTRSYAAAFSLNGKGYIGTGLLGNTAYNDFWEYDPGNNSWTQKANFAGGFRYAAVGLSIGNKGYIGTGYDMTAGLNKNDFWEYDPVTNTWTQRANVGTQLRRQAAGFTIGNKGYIGTGWDGASHRNDLWEYDPMLNTWTQKANITGPRYGAFGVSQGNKGYIGGGQVISGSGNEFWEYNPSLNTWTAKTNIGGTTTRVGAVGFAIGNRIIVTGGSTANDTWEYNPSLDSWISRAVFSGPNRSNAAAFVINGKGYVACGIAGTTSYSDLWQYNPTVEILWSTGATTPSISVANTGTYSLVFTNLAGCSSNATQVFSITPIPTVSINGLNSVCNGESLVLTANGANSYTWSANAGNVSTTSVNITPTTTTSYTLIGATNGCTATASKNVTVNAVPSVTANSSSTLICQGFNVTLSGAGASTYSWSGGVFNNTPFAPSSSANYTLIGSTINNCTNTAVISVSVNPSPTVTINSGSICSGQSFTLNPNGALSYTFSNGTNVVSPLSNTSYSVIGSNSVGCTNAAPAVATITVFALPTISASNGIICAGNSFTIQPTGAATYTISGGSNVVTPANTSTYGIIGTSTEGCLSSSQAVVTVSVEALPVVSVSSGTICSGFNFNLNPTGANSYSFSPGSSAVVNPSTTTVYSVTGISPIGCLSSSLATATISVLTSPTVSLNSGSICEGQSFTLVPSGAISYTFLNGSNIVTPLATTIYSITGTNANGCTNAIPATATITVNTTPTISATGSAICFGDSYTINPSGASTYTYSGGSNIVSPLQTSTYSIIGSSSIGCISNSSVIITVTVNPTPSISISSGTVCNGTAFNLNPLGAVSYTIFPGGMALVTPNSSLSYSVIGTNSFGCTNVAPAVANVTVVPLPLLSVNSGSICSGSSFTLIPNGAVSYTFSNGSPMVTPNSTTTYSVIGTDINGCVNNVPAISTITVNPLPLISANNATICNGQSHTIVPSGASTYTFSSGSNIVSPSSSAVYTISGTSAQGCIGNYAIVCVSVQPSLTISITGSATVCEGKQLVLTAGGANSYSWSTGTIGSSIITTPLASTVYIVNATSGVCTASASQAISLIPSPSLSVINAVPDLCLGNTTTITANGADQYNWSDGSTVPFIVVTPTETTTYTLSGTNFNGCSSLLIITQMVSPCTDIVEKSFSQLGILVYPNPASEQVNIVTDKEMSAELYTVNGQLVHKLKLNTGTNTINIKGLSAGMYFVRIQKINENVIQKFIIQQ